MKLSARTENLIASGKGYNSATRKPIGKPMGRIVC